ncbi:MAG: sporulation protein YabP [Clostridia bacterium]|nr:sporulation protein YabP [Clostridia bacterium]
MKREQSANCTKRHSVIAENRESIVLCGVDEVLSYDEESVVMQSVLGQLTIEGEGLNIVKLNLDEGEVCINGKLNALYYMEQQKGQGILSRLFK